MTFLQIMLADAQWLLGRPASRKDDGCLTFDEASKMLEAPHVDPAVREAFRDYKIFRNARTEARFNLVCEQSNARRAAKASFLEEMHRFLALDHPKLSPWVRSSISAYLIFQDEKRLTVLQAALKQQETEVYGAVAEHG